MLVSRKGRRQNGKKSSEKKRSRMWTQPTPECYWWFDAQNGSYTERLVVSCCCCCCYCRLCSIIFQSECIYCVRRTTRTNSLSLLHLHTWTLAQTRVECSWLWFGAAMPVKFTIGRNTEFFYVIAHTAHRHTHSLRHNHMCMVRTGYCQPVDRMNQSPLNVW